MFTSAIYECLKAEFCGVYTHFCTMLAVLLMRIGMDDYTDIDIILII